MTTIPRQRNAIHRDTYHLVRQKKDKRTQQASWSAQQSWWRFVPITSSGCSFRIRIGFLKWKIGEPCILQSRLSVIWSLGPKFSWTCHVLSKEDGTDRMKLRIHDSSTFQEQGSNLGLHQITEPCFFFFKTFIGGGERALFQIINQLATMK